MEWSGKWTNQSFTLPSHIEQRDDGWWIDTTNGKFIHDKWIKWYCKKYWDSQDINDVTGKKIKRRAKKYDEPYKSKIDWGLEDGVVVVKEKYKEI